MHGRYKQPILGQRDLKVLRLGILKREHMGSPGQAGHTSRFRADCRMSCLKPVFVRDIACRSGPAQGENPWKASLQWVITCQIIHTISTSSTQYGGIPHHAESAIWLLSTKALEPEDPEASDVSLEHRQPACEAPCSRVLTGAEAFLPNFVCLKLASSVLDFRWLLRFWLVAQKPFVVSRFFRVWGLSNGNRHIRFLLAYVVKLQACAVVLSAFYLAQASRSALRDLAIFAVDVGRDSVLMCGPQQSRVHQDGLLFPIIPEKALHRVHYGDGDFRA